MKTAVKEIKVGLNFGSGIQSVGRLAIRNSIIYFEYDEAFLNSNLENFIFQKSVSLQTSYFHCN